MATYNTLRVGSTGEDVKKLQQALGITADGIYGNQTANAVKEYQKSNGLTVDGIAGNQTLGSLFGNNTSNNNANTKLNGVDQNTQDRAYNNTFNASDDTNQQKNKADSALGNFEDIASVTDIIDPSTKEAMNKPFEESDEYTQANEVTKGLFDKLVSGKTSYTDQINDLISQIMNREDFEYDVDKDPLFQQALASAMNSGRSAMQDTIGQASALTGGYGSTYATSAGNQAYNAFIEDAYNNLPEYYQMALEAYQMEGQELYNQFNMLSTADATEYQRMYNSWDASFRNTQDIWNKDFSTWEAGVNQAFNSANIQLNEHGQLVDNAYKIFAANMDVYESMYAKEYQSWQDDVTQAQQYAQALNTDYWNDQTYKQTDYWNQQDQNYKNASLAEDKRQFNYSIGDTNNDGVVSPEEKEAMNQYANWINPDEVEVDPTTGAITNIPGYDIAGADGKGTKNSPAISGFRTTKGDNFTISIGDNEYKVENQGKVKDDATKSALKSATAYGDIVVYNNKAYIKYGDDYYKLGHTNGFLNIGVSSKSGYDGLLVELQK